MTDKDFPAFPRQWDKDGHNGMTLRDYFAGEALPAVYAETCKDSRECGWHPEWKQIVALDSYAMADAMLKARKS